MEMTTQASIDPSSNDESLLPKLVLDSKSALFEISFGKGPRGSLHTLGPAANLTSSHPLAFHRLCESRWLCKSIV